MWQVSCSFSTAQENAGVIFAVAQQMAGGRQYLDDAVAAGEVKVLHALVGQQVISIAFCDWLVL
jgi:UDP-N-acetylmuramyl tripeptide synthase